jgi:hypothetical protein
MTDPYTIRIFVPDGNPDGLRIIDQMNWTGLGIVFPREDWPKIKQRTEFGRPGVYILIGRITDDDLPTIYIGQGDVVRDRLADHFASKDFWSSAAVFVSSVASGGLNRAHATWLEHALIQRAHQIKQSHLENSSKPQEPQLSEAERAETLVFLRETLQILPLIGLNCFEKPKIVAAPMAKSAPISTATNGDGPDTVIVPAHKDKLSEDVHRRERLVGNPDAWRHDAKDQIHRRLPDKAGSSHHAHRAGGADRAIWRQGEIQTDIFGTGEANQRDSLGEGPSHQRHRTTLHHSRQIAGGQNSERSSPLGMIVLTKTKSARTGDIRGSYQMPRLPEGDQR